MTETEQMVLAALLDLERTIEAMPHTTPKPSLLPLFSRLDDLTRSLPVTTDPTLLHYLHKKSYQKARLFLQGREAESNLAVTTYNQAVIDAVHDLADAVTSIQGLARTSVEQAAARKATDEAYGLAVVRYRAGLGNYLTVLTAQTQQLAQDRLNVDLAARAFELDVNLARALGGGYTDPAALQLSAARP